MRYRLEISRALAYIFCLHKKKLTILSNIPEQGGEFFWNCEK